MTIRSITLGISTKMYLGYSASKEWLETVASIAAAAQVLHTGQVKLFIAPSFPVLETTLGLASNAPFSVAAQNASDQDSGALTGEVSPAFLAEMGVELIEIGHAERRGMFHEDEDMVAAKVAAAQRNGIAPLLCIGEQTRTDPAEAARVCLHQVEAARINPHGQQPVIAYEPLWAIGAPHPASADYVRAVASLLREGLPPDTTLLYGGSAGPGLLPELYPLVDGLFLGRFAHDPRNLALILEEAAHLIGRTSNHTDDVR